MTYVKVFGLFLYDFIVGDSLVIGIGIPLVVLTTWVLAQALPDNRLLEALFPLGVIAVFALSLRTSKAK